MNTVGSRLKAIAITALFFAFSALALLGLVWALAALLPAGFPGKDLLQAYRPHDTISAVSDLQLVSALSSAYLIAAAAVLILNSGYLDRMLAVFADVLLMFIAAGAGFVAGYWIMLRLAGYENFLTIGFLQLALVCPVLVFGVSLVPLHRLRARIFVRLLATLVLLAAAPALLLLVP